MSESYRKNVVEAALLAAGRPLQLADLAQLFAAGAQPTDAELKAALEALAADYAERALELKLTASGWRVQVRGAFAAEISRLWPERPARYSRALLETLALIAYRQPITRGEIETVRGVAVNPNIIKTLLERNWVRVVGTRDVPGRPELLGTTREFLDYFGLESVDELPPLAELKAMTEINVQLDLAGGAPGPMGDGAAAAAASGAEPVATDAAAAADFTATGTAAVAAAAGRFATQAQGPGEDAGPGAGPCTQDEATLQLAAAAAARAAGEEEEDEACLAAQDERDGRDERDEQGGSDEDDEGADQDEEDSAAGPDAADLVAAPPGRD